MMDFGDSQNDWLFSRKGETLKVKVSPQVLASEPSVLISSMGKQGAALMPLWAARDAMKSSAFCRILDGWEISPAGGPGKVLLNVPATKAALPEVKSFISHLQRQVKEAALLRPL